MPERTDSATDASLYAVLGLPEPAANRSFSPAQVRVAFRRALLKHHPDKAARLLNEPDSKAASTQGKPVSKYTVDTICLARDILTGPERAVAGLHPTELETLDLDDMIYNEDSASWAKTCRCGNPKAYEVFEEDLEIASSDGGHEVLVGCGGCSLFVRVVFEAVDAD